MSLILILLDRLTQIFWLKKKKKQNVVDFVIADSTMATVKSPARRHGTGNSVAASFVGVGKGFLRNPGLSSGGGLICNKLTG